MLRGCLGVSICSFLHGGGKKKKKINGKCYEIIRVAGKCFSGWGLGNHGMGMARKDGAGGAPCASLAHPSATITLGLYVKHQNLTLKKPQTQQLSCLQILPLSPHPGLKTSLKPRPPDTAPSL